MSRRWRRLFSLGSRGSRGSEPPRPTSWRPCRSSCRTARAVLHARWSAKPEKLDHLNDPLVLGDAVIQQHRSPTEDLHRALVELLTKRVLDGDRLAERLQRGGEVALAGVRQRGNRGTDRLGADPEGFDHPGRGSSRPANTSSSDLASPGTRAGGSRRRAAQRSAQPARSAGPARADTSPAQRLPAQRSPGCRPPPWLRQPAPVGTAGLLVAGRVRSGWQGCDADGSAGPRRWWATDPRRAAQPCSSPLPRPQSGQVQPPLTSLVGQPPPRATMRNVYLPPAAAETPHWSPCPDLNRRCEAGMLAPRLSG